jgi:hypothetical protein
VWFKHAQYWFLHVEYDFHTQSVILYADYINECNFDTYEFDYDTLECDYDTLECDLHTQGVISTRRV